MWNRERWKRIIVTILMLALFALAAWLGHLYGKRRISAEERHADRGAFLLLSGRSPEAGVVVSSLLIGGGGGEGDARQEGLVHRFELHPEGGERSNHPYVTPQPETEGETMVKPTRSSMPACLSTRIALPSATDVVTCDRAADALPRGGQGRAA